MQENKSLSIIVPYRDRAQHLAKFIPYMKARFVNSEIIVVEQTDTKPFNRGKLLNIGVLENKADYYALHDVDMLPVKSDYSYPVYPTLLATQAQQFGYKMPFAEYFGGVVLISYADMFASNGYDNEFWSWGAEDCSFRLRVLDKVGKIESRQCTYTSLAHDRKIDQQLYPKNVQRLKQGKTESGLSDCEYTILKKELLNGYTKITVEI